MEETNNEAVVDESALDAELEASISAIKAGNEQPAPQAEPAQPETPVETQQEEKAEETSAPQKTEGEYDFRVPNKGKFESDESYEKRIELMDLVKRRKLARTEEQKQAISEQIKTTKGQLKNLNGADKLLNSINKEEERSTAPDIEDETLKADRERLKELGGVTAEDIQTILQKERQTIEVKSTLERFIDRHTELQDEDTREIFFDFVDSNYNWQNKSGKDLMTVLELARESMFKPSETLQERVLTGANVQEKVNAMQFPGGTVITKQSLAPDVKRAVDELVATGMSEEKALELISE